MLLMLGKLSFKGLVYHSKELGFHPIGGRESVKESVVCTETSEMRSECTGKDGSGSRRQVRDSRSDPCMRQW